MMLRTADAAGDLALVFGLDDPVGRQFRVAARRSSIQARAGAMLGILVAQPLDQLDEEGFGSAARS